MNRKLRNTLVIAAVVLIAGAALAARLKRGGTAGHSSAIVAQEDFRVVVEATGKLEAAVAFEIGPPSVRDFWKYSLTWMIPEGSRVAEGDVVARFDTTQLDEQLREYAAQLETTQQQQEKEQENLHYYEYSVSTLDLETDTTTTTFTEDDEEEEAPADFLSEPVSSMVATCTGLVFDTCVLLEERCAHMLGLDSCSDSDDDSHDFESDLDPASQPHILNLKRNKTRKIT